MPLDPKIYNPSYMLAAQQATANMSFPVAGTGPSNTTTGATGPTAPTGPMGSGRAPTASTGVTGPTGPTGSGL